MLKLGLHLGAQYQTIMQLTAKAALNHALLISIATPEFKGDEATESLAELARLVTTLGFKVVGSQSQKLSSTKKLNVLGLGKLAEIAHLTGNKGSVEEDDFEEINEAHATDKTLTSEKPLADIPSDLSLIHI